MGSADRHRGDRRHHDAADTEDDLDDEEAQSGLGRGLTAILAAPTEPPSRAAGGLSSLFGVPAATPTSPTPSSPPSPTSAPMPTEAARLPRHTPDVPALPALPVLPLALPALPLAPSDPRRREVVHPDRGPQREVVESRLRALVASLDLDVAVHLRPGPGGGRLIVVRPVVGRVPRPEMDELCRSIRTFVADRALTTDDVEAAAHHCVAFGPRPLTSAGVYVLGRRDVGLTMDERWAVHQRLAPAALPA